MARSGDIPPSAPPTLTLRTGDDLAALGAFLRTYRRRHGVGTAKEAAPLLGVGYRLLVQLESGTRGKRGVTLGKLLPILEGLGLELVLQPRHRSHVIHGPSTHGPEDGAPPHATTDSAKASRTPARPRKPTTARTRGGKA